MSGSMSMPPGQMPGGPMPGGQGPMAGGAAPGMPQGQLPPQVLAMLLQATRGQGGPMQMQSAGPMQPGVMPQMPRPGMAQVPGTSDMGGAPSVPGTQDAGVMQQASAMPSQQPIPAPMAAGMQGPVGGAVGGQQMSSMTAGGQRFANSMMNQMAQKGRFGDTQMAHLTKGEIAVPPQVQTPQVLATLQQAFKGVGADVRQFASGSPFAAHNPDTGQQEFSIWSAILPVVGAIGGALLGGVGAGPGAAAGSAAGAAADAGATAAASGAASTAAGAGAGAAAGGLGASGGAAIGGALGGAAGGALDHTGPLGILAGAAGGGLGGYLGMGGTLDSLLGAGAAATPTGPTANAISSGATLGAPSGDAGQAAMAARMAAGDSPAMMTAGALPQVAPKALTAMQLLKGGMAAGTGAGIGQMFAPPPGSGNSSNTPPGFNQPLGPVNPNLMIGGRPAVSTPNFTGYNPYTSVTSGSPFTFFR